MFINFRMINSWSPVANEGKCVQVVNNYKYLGVYSDDKLDWSTDMDGGTLQERTESHLFPEKTLWCLQGTFECVLSVCCGQCYLLYCGVLGQWCECG